MLVWRRGGRCHGSQQEHGGVQGTEKRWCGRGGFQHDVEQRSECRRRGLAVRVLCSTRCGLRVACEGACEWWRVDEHVR